MITCCFQFYVIGVLGFNLDLDFVGIDGFQMMGSLPNLWWETIRGLGACG